MSKAEQPSFFVDPEMPPLEDIANVARRIAENSRKIVPDDRTSEAARDQGWGPTNVSSSSTTSHDAPRTHMTADQKRLAQLRPIKERFQQTTARSEQKPKV